MVSVAKAELETCIKQQEALAAATQRRADAKATFEQKRHAFEEADKTHHDLIAAGGCDDGAALHSWHKRE